MLLFFSVEEPETFKFHKTEITKMEILVNPILSPPSPPSSLPQLTANQSSEIYLKQPPKTASFLKSRHPFP